MILISVEMSTYPKWVLVAGHGNFHPHSFNARRAYGRIHDEIQDIAARRTLDLRLQHEIIE